jgi:hypothetical protein
MYTRWYRRGEMHIQFWWESQMETGHFDGNMVRILKKYDGMEWSGFIRLRIGKVAFLFIVLLL